MQRRAAEATTVTPAFFVASLSHRSLPVEVRERRALDRTEIAAVLRDLDAVERLPEAMILSTCNRVAVYGVDAGGERAAAGVLDRLCAHRSLETERVRPLARTLTDAEAIRHVFRVAASLDSMIVGHPAR